MTQFKVQLVKQQPPVLPQPQLKKPPKLSIQIQSITCLNYPIQTLVEVITSHFDEEPCATNTIVKALKIISVSLKDKELQGGVCKILGDNIHRKAKMYDLMTYWSATVTHLPSILQKLQTKLVQNIIGCVMAYYCLTKCKKNHYISRLITDIISQFGQQSCNKIGQYVKNQYLSLGCPFEQFIGFTDKFDFKDEGLYAFFSELSSSLVKTKQTDIVLQKLLLSYFKNKQIRQKVDSFFSKFPNVIGTFTKCLTNNMSNYPLLQVWSKCSTYKLQYPIRISIKEWVNRKQNYWKLFSQNFNKYREQQQHMQFNELKQGSLVDLLGLGNQLEQQQVISQFIIKQYLYNYLQNIELYPEKQANMLKVLSQNAQSDLQGTKRFHNQIQLINQVIKSYKNKLQDGPIRIITINKTYAQPTWSLTDINLIRSKNSKYKAIQPFLDQFFKLFDSLEKRSLEKGQKVELAYIGINIYLIEQKLQLTVTLDQLIQIINRKNTTQVIQKKIDLRVEYRPLEQKKVQPKKQLQSIVIQAKIVKIIKKINQKLDFNKIYEQVVKQLKITEQSCQLALSKVVNKGLVQKLPQDLYVYCP